ncbi:MAG: cupredoxin domain-containing protein [Acidimicrobiales bacterium]
MEQGNRRDRNGKMGISGTPDTRMRGRKGGKIVAGLLVLALAVLVAACGGLPASPAVQKSVTPGKLPRGPVAAVVQMRYVAFEPSIVTIHTGQAVEWIMDDGPIPGNVHFPRLRVTSPTESSGKWYHTFYKPGVYDYVSTIHSTMFGKVIVKS